MVARGRDDLTTNASTWNRIVQELWGADPKAHRDNDLANFAQQTALPPDFAASAADKPVPMEWIHRATSDADIYFLANPTDKPISFTGHFRVAGRQPELWDAVAGTHNAAPVFRETEGLTEVDLSLDSYGSIFVVFRGPLPARWTTAVTKSDGTGAFEGVDFDPTANGLALHPSTPLQMTFSDGTTQALSADNIPPAISVEGPWNVTFRQPGCDAFTRKFDQLHSFLDDTDPAVKYFSGQAIYRNTVTVPKNALGENQRCLLNLGTVCDIASVSVNHHDAGTAWTPPYALDISPLLKEGDNEIEITVADRWINRLIADEQLPADVEYSTSGDPRSQGGIAEIPAWFYDPSKPRTHHRTTLLTWDFFKDKFPPKDIALVPAGLIGPVQLEFSRVVTPPR
jgi:hypothetical protein